MKSTFFDARNFSKNENLYKNNFLTIYFLLALVRYPINDKEYKS